MPDRSRPTLDELRRVALAEERGEPRHDDWAARTYLRRISLPITRAIAARDGLRWVTPDGLTFTVLVLGLAAAGVIAGSRVWWAPLIAVVAIQLARVLGCVDGELARWRKETTARGVYLSRLTTHVTAAALVMGLGIRAGGGLMGRGLFSEASPGWGPGTGWADDGVTGAIASLLARWPIGGLLETGASWWFLVGAVSAALLLVSRLAAELVPAARAVSGRKLAPQADPLSRLWSVRTVQRALEWVPVHVLLRPLELSLAVLATALVDLQRGDALATQLLALIVLVLAAVASFGQAAAVLTSKRLR